MQPGASQSKVEFGVDLRASGQSVGCMYAVCGWELHGRRLAGARSGRIGGRDGNREGRRECQRDQATAWESCSSRVPKHAALMVRSRWWLQEREACPGLGPCACVPPHQKLAPNALPGTHGAQRARAGPTRGPNSPRPFAPTGIRWPTRQSGGRCPGALRATQDAWKMKLGVDKNPIAGTLSPHEETCQAHRGGINLSKVKGG
jgi:hypothetical protein